MGNRQGTAGRSVKMARVLLVLGAITLIASCVAPHDVAQTPSACVLRLATTTSTDDSGLLEALLPDFEGKFGCRVDVIAVGTGQALALGSRGDADVLLVHDKPREEEFVRQGYATARYDVMYNDFVIVGPIDDPAHVSGATSAADAFQRIAEAQAPFASRGDESGTHAKERQIWLKARVEPSVSAPWYFSVGKGMGPTLVFANEKRAYTLADRGTYLAMSKNLPELNILFGGKTIADNPDPQLLNPYGVLPINPQRHRGVNYEMAMRFVQWITSAEVQRAIGEFGKAEFGQPLFHSSDQSG